MTNEAQQVLTFSGTVISVENDIVIQKVNGSGTYTGSRLSYRDGRGSPRDKTFTSKTLEMNPNVAAALQALKPSEQFTVHYVKSGQYSNVVDITKGASSASKTSDAAASKTSNDTGYSAAGPIKGNIVSNAVILATAINGKNTNKEHLESAAELLIGLHAFLESKDILAEIAARKTVHSEASTTEEAF